MAANYMVGGPNGWWDTTTGLQTWASSQSFSVGDNLMIFDYDSCQASHNRPSLFSRQEILHLFLSQQSPNSPEDNDGIFSVILEEDNDGIFIHRSGSCLSCGK
ncbi:uncharacterized protein LOC133860721 [Alnus glutinosa]|uniref:uncharacterized protein LOC133860721 n=1 Tax=Alnus glutinosa TaxID=3517 RepID=UPI002D78A47D|nr:uncharacterized protein LOC133860721 [Alnus glutinosa]